MSLNSNLFCFSLAIIFITVHPAREQYRSSQSKKEHNRGQGRMTIVKNLVYFDVPKEKLKLHDPNSRRRFG
jgi:hypothetical protein